MTRIIHSVLILAIVVGFGLLLRQHASVRDLRVERNRLAAKYGFFDIHDKDKFHVQQLKTKDPYYFAWRVYKPGGISAWHKDEWCLGGSSGGGGVQAEGREFVFRCRFTFEDGRPEAHTLRDSGSSRPGFSHPVLSKFLLENWDLLDVELLDNGEYSQDDILSFIKVTMPESVRGNLRGLRPRELERLATMPVFSSVYGKKEVLEEAERTQTQ